METGNLIQEVKRASLSIIQRIEKKDSSSKKLKKIFLNCFMNTAETTVSFSPEAFVITGDIHAMWLRDSSAQVVYYLPFAREYPMIKALIESLLLRQFNYISIDPYSNAFMENETCDSKYTTDKTLLSPVTWERKYEIDSLCYPVWLLWNYYSISMDDSLFENPIIKDSLSAIVDLWIVEQHHEEKTPYSFERPTARRPTDTLPCNGKGTPVAYTGMTWSGFRPSDDACTYGYLIPSNHFATEVLTYIENIEQNHIHDDKVAEKAETLRQQITGGIVKYGIVDTEKYDRIYAYEADGFGNFNLMDDANVPSLLSLPWLGVCSRTDEIYLNTRRFLLSNNNPYFFEGLEAKGIGSPHTPDGYIWPIALIIQGLTSTDEKEKKKILDTLLNARILLFKRYI